MENIACTLCAIDRNETVPAIGTMIVDHPNGWSVFFSVCSECQSNLERVVNAPFN